MKYFFNLIKILTISNFLFINNIQAKNEQGEGQVIKVPSEHYHYLLQREQEARTFQTLNKEFVAEKKRVNDLMSTLTKTLKERKTASKKQKKDDEISQTHFINGIVSVDRETSSNTKQIK